MNDNEPVLVVEDQWWTRAFIRVGLEGAGFTTIDVADAETALEVLDAMPTVRVLVTDVDLGAGMGGLALAAGARRRCPGLHVVYVTGDPDRVDRRPLAQWERLVPKPFALGALVGVVSEVAALAAGGRATPSPRETQEQLDWIPLSGVPAQYRSV